MTTTRIWHHETCDSRAYTYDNADRLPSVMAQINDAIELLDVTAIHPADGKRLYGDLARIGATLRKCVAPSTASYDADALAVAALVSRDTAERAQTKTYAANLKRGWDDHAELMNRFGQR